MGEVGGETRTDNGQSEIQGFFASLRITTFSSIAFVDLP
jgi:hypothetical protein